MVTKSKQRTFEQKEFKVWIKSEPLKKKKNQNISSPSLQDTSGQKLEEAE